MLFLAGGNASLRRDPLSIACLTLALCPRFPNKTIDNQYHLQAWRHLVALAVESRCLQGVDIDSGKQLELRVNVHLRNPSTKPIIMTTPCLLPELRLVRAVQVEEVDSNGSKMFFPTFLDFIRGSPVVSSSVISVFVKRRDKTELLSKFFYLLWRQQHQIEESRHQHSLSLFQRRNKLTDALCRTSLNLPTDGTNNIILKTLRLESASKEQLYFSYVLHTMGSSTGSTSGFAGSSVFMNVVGPSLDRNKEK